MDEGHNKPVYDILDAVTNAITAFHKASDRLDGTHEYIQYPEKITSIAVSMKSDLLL